MKQQKTNYPVSTVPVTSEDDRTEFACYQDEYDRARWQGRGMGYVYPSGDGNAPKSGGVKPGD